MTISPEIIINLPVAQARLEKNMAFDGYDVHIMAEQSDRRIVMMHPLSNPVLEHVERGSTYAPTPAFRLNHDSAQSFFDAMWRAGLRPSSGDTGTGSDGTIRAMSEHINDLRAMAGLVKQSPDKPTQHSTY